jgi:hypothetical protein
MTTHTTTQRRIVSVLPQIAALAVLATLALVPIARAGSYVINNCPAAPVSNGNPGPWSIFGSPGPKGGCGGGPGDYIAARGPSMSANTSDGVQVDTPAGITIHEAKVWWAVPSALSGAINYAITLANGAIISESNTPLQQAKSVWVLPSHTTSLQLVNYCSASDGPYGCAYEGNVANHLLLFGSQLTLEDTSLPTGNATGGTLMGAGSLTGSQSIVYTAADPSSGVRAVKLLIDGAQAAGNDYIERCPYEDYLACPASISDRLAWNTASVADGQHSLELEIEDAAQNTTIAYTTTINTHNAPVNTSTPTLSTSEAQAGSSVSVQPGSWSAPGGTGPITYGYQWQDCDSEGTNCQAIAAAQAVSYTPTAADTGHTLRAIVTATDNDGASSQDTNAITTPPTHPASTGSPNGQGAANGTPASETALIRLNGAAVLHRFYTHRAFLITGTLTDSHGNPIASATLDILQQIATTTTTTILQHVTTSATGTFTALIPRGPSRRITIAYRAHNADPTYTTTATTTETVGAGVKLHITPLTHGPNSTIKITGKVAGPIPPQGTIVDVLVHYHGSWITIRTPRTHHNGTFHLTYQFQNATGTFPFQLAIPAGQATFPYTHGHSNRVPITT